jgi:protein O-GlcNAc transferase
MQNHGHQEAEVFCYSQVREPDAFTHRLQQLSGHWRSTVGFTDEQVCKQVREDQIDILVDLKLHTPNNRLLVFALKPAPVQVTWLGYPGSTGLSTIDYRLSDPYLDPLDMDETIYSEKTIRLPDTFWCYHPLDGHDIPVNALPAQNAGTITFGCLNNFSKLNEGILALWAQVLRQVDGSRLLLLANRGAHQDRTRRFLSEREVDPQRVTFAPRQHRVDYFKLYHRVDVQLDSFPCNGHTTSLDSFWMGVPVVTLVGQTPFSRAGWSQLSNLGLTELAGHTPDQFVKIAVDLARDLPRLQTLRSTLRQRMEQSPLMDAPRFARNIEAAYRQMWRKWCETETASQ